MKKVLVLFSYRQPKHDSPNYDGFVNTLNKQSPKYGYQADYAALDNLEFKIVNGQARVFEPRTKKDLAGYDLVFFRMWKKEFERATAAAIYLKKMGVAFIDAEVYSSRAFTKLVGYLLMWSAGIPIPDTFLGPHSAIIKTAKAGQEFKFPLILKAVDAKKGNSNFLVKNIPELTGYLNDNPELDFVLQNYIPNDGDYRVLVAGNKVGLVIKREAAANSHLNNTSAGAAARLVNNDDLSEVALADAIKSSQVRKRDLSGVDVIIDKNTGKHYILEVNKVPQIITGACVEDKIKAFHEFMQNKLESNHD